MKIGMCTHYSPFPPFLSGAEKHVWELSTLLNKEGHEVFFMCNAGGGKGVTLLQDPVLLSKTRYSLFMSLFTRPFSYFLDLRKIIKKSEIGLLHIHNHQFLPSALFLKNLNHFPSILTTHWFPFKMMAPEMKAGYKCSWYYAEAEFLSYSLGIKAVERVICPSVYMANRLRELDSSIPVSVIPNAINVSEYQEDLNRTTPDQEDFTILFLGRLVKEKGLDYLIEACKNVSPSMKLKILIAGKDPERQNLLNTVKKADLSKRIVFLGFLTEQDKMRWLKSVDAFVVPSIFEAFGIVCIEALAADSQLSPLM